MQIGKSDLINFNKKFWNQINNIRGYIDVSEYKDIFLPLLYFKYANDRYNSTDSGGFQMIIPETANWDFLRNNAQHNTGDVLNKAFYEMGRQNPNFINVFTAFDFNKKSNREFNNALFNIIQFLSDYDFYNDENKFGEIFEGVFMQFIEMEGRNAFIPPKELVHLMNSFSPENDKLSTYNPFSGYGSFALLMPENGSFYGQESNSETNALAHLRLLAHDLEGNYQLENSSPIEYKSGVLKDTGFDFIVSNPPLRARLNREQSQYSPTNQKFLEPYLIEKSINQLSKDGKAIFAVAGGFLFSGNKTEKSLRRKLVELDLVEMVVALPTKILFSTSIPLYLIVLNKNKKLHQQTKFVDATECFVEVSKRLNKIDLEKTLQLVGANEDDEKVQFSDVKEIKENDFNLIPHRYIPLENEADLLDNEEVVVLKQIIKSVPRLRNNDFVEGKLIKIGNLSSDIKQLQTSFDDAEVVELPRNTSILPDNCLILATRFSALKPTFHTTSADNIFYIPGNIAVFKVDEKRVYVEYLLQELRQDYVINQVSKYIKGAAIPFISKDDLNALKIKLPAIDKQKEIVLKRLSVLLNKEDAKVTEKIKELELDKAEENVYLRHHIAGPLGNVRKSFSALCNIIDNQLLSQVDELMEIKVNPLSKLTFKDYINIIQRDLDSISNSLDRTSKEAEIVNLEKEKIDIVKFLDDYCVELCEKEGDNFKILNKNDWLKNEVESAKLTIYVEGDRSKLRKMFDNLFENAIKHAFSNSNYWYHEFSIEAIWLSEDYGTYPDDLEKQGIFIDVRNTCESLPSNFSTETYKRKGSTAGKNAGDGYGGWFVNEVIKEFNGYDLSIGEDGSIDEYETDSEIHVINEFEVSWMFPIKIEYNG